MHQKQPPAKMAFSRCKVLPALTGVTMSGRINSDPIMNFPNIAVSSLSTLYYNSASLHYVLLPGELAVVMRIAKSEDLAGNTVEAANNREIIIVTVFAANPAYPVPLKNYYGGHVSS
ncbi:MAG TPA: hypothetical protein VLG72_09780 [Nitrospirota bacterium]|nr:hypothetical protein [Nitrospirota bacterium]